MPLTASAAATRIPAVIPNQFLRNLAIFSTLAAPSLFAHANYTRLVGAVQLFSSHGYRQAPPFPVRPASTDTRKVHVAGLDIYRRVLDSVSMGHAASTKAKLEGKRFPRRVSVSRDKT